MEENKTLDNGTIVAIRFTNGDNVKIRCREFYYDEATTCFYISDDCYRNVAIVPREQIAWKEAGCLICITPLLVMYGFLQKHFTEGIERSGLVG